jgi:DNA-binding SARP family transcriptional activator
MRARNAVTVVLALSATGMLWAIRPPLHELAPSAPLSMQQLATDAYLASWLGLLLVCLSQTRRLLRRVTSSHSVTSEESRLFRRPRQRSAPLAMPQPLPRMTVASQVRPNLATSSHEPQNESPTETHSVNDPWAPDRASVLLLGPLTVTGARAERHGLRAAALELLAYLALHPHGATRDELLEALWPDQDPRKTRGRLYQATRDARRLLGANAISRTKERYLLERSAITVDLDELEKVLATASGESEPQARLKLLEHALGLFRSEPLVGVDYHWAEPHLRRLRSVLIDLLTEIGNARLRAGNAAGALELAERGIAIDTLNEELWRLALSAEGALGLRTAAEDRYRRLQNLLDQQLGLTPANETRSLFRQVLAQS